MTVTRLPSTAPHTPVVALSAAVEALAAQVPAELPDPVALERARALLAEVERLTTVAPMALADVDVRELHVLDGSPTTHAWVDGLAVAGVDRGLVTLARRLPRQPLVTEALKAGRLAGRAAARVGSALAKARPHLDRPGGEIDGQPGEPALQAVIVDGIGTLLSEQAGGAQVADPVRADLTAIAEGRGTQAQRLEAALVLLAEHTRPGLLGGSLDLLLDALLPAEHDKRAQRAEDRVGLELHRDPLGSGWLLRAELDDETGELLAVALDAAGAVDERNPGDTAAWREAASDPTLADLPPAQWPTTRVTPRSRAARAHDALRAVLRRVLDAGALGARDKALPHLAVTVDLDHLNGLPGSLPGRTSHGARLTRRQLRARSCTSMITRLVLGPDRRVLAASHTQRTATALERLIVHSQWGGVCARDGCTRGPGSGHRLIPHHAELFSSTGRTALADTVPLCESDHHHLHDDGRPLRLGDGRWIGPDGWLSAESA